jgi:lipopolysaccharide biosynthesis glycosyltransferase
MQEEQAETGDYEIHIFNEEVEKMNIADLKEAVLKVTEEFNDACLEDLLLERDMLADENKKMAEYLVYLHECNKIDLVRDNLSWLITTEED